MPAPARVPFLADAIAAPAGRASVEIQSTLSFAAGVAEALATSLSPHLGGGGGGAVTSVAGRTGVIVLAIEDIGELGSTLNLKAPLASPALTGAPTAPTAADGTNTTQIATTQFVTTAVAAGVAGLLDSAPAALNTLNELATALGGDEAFAATTAAALGNRLRVDAAQGLSSGQQGQALTNLGASATGKLVLAGADASAIRGTLGLVIGTNVQAYSAVLAALANSLYVQSPGGYRFGFTNAGYSLRLGGDFAWTYTIGSGAVELLFNRAGADDGAVGYSSVVSGGYGQRAGGDYSWVPGGQMAEAFAFGMGAWSAGYFQQRGDCQRVELQWRGIAYDGNPLELFLDGGSQRPLMRGGMIMAGTVIVIGNDGSDNPCIYIFQGHWVLRQDGGGASADWSTMYSRAGSINGSANVNFQVTWPDFFASVIVSASNFTGDFGATVRWSASFSGLLSHFPAA